MPNRLISHFVFLANIDELAQVLRKDKIEGPVESHANLLFQARQFAQINSAPHPPCGKAGHVHPEDTGNAGTMSNGRKLAYGLEVELPELPSVRVRDDVLCHDPTLAECMLSCWRAELTRAEIWNHGAISQSPHAR